MRVKNKVAVITGAASGIGKAIAEKYVQEGAHVVLTDVNMDKLQQVAKTLQQDNTNKVLALNMDVINEAQVNNTIDHIHNEFGRIDILVSNAGIQHLAPMHELNYADWQRVLHVHLDGAFLTTRACLRHMYTQSHGGSIIYLGSIHSKIASQLKAPYITAKHGLIGLCKAVAVEGAAYGVTANVICPGFVRTPLVENQLPVLAEKYGVSEDEIIRTKLLGNTVDGEFTDINDISELAIYLASFSSQALTGQSLIAGHGAFME